MKEQLPNGSGIYAIYNRTNGKCYVGSAVLVRKRVVDHKSDLRCGRHFASRLQRAWNKYGEAVFDFKCLEEIADKSRLVEREQFWIDFLMAANRAHGYNSRPKADNNLGLRHTEQSKAKMSAARKGVPNDKLRGKPLLPETRAKLSAAHQGKALSAEHRAALSTGHKGKRHSIETIAKLSEAARARSPEWRLKMSAAAREQVRRGIGITAINASKTHCLKGHPLSGENLYRRPNGRRDCWECKRDSYRRYLDRCQSPSAGPGAGGGANAGGGTV